MKSPFFAGFACGLVSALLFFSGTTGTGLGAILTMLSPMPLFIASLGFGRTAGLTAAGGGALFVAFGLAGSALFYYLLFAVLPVLLLSHFVLLNRTVPGAAPLQTGGASQAFNLEWFPIGLVVLAAAGLASLAVAAALITAFPSYEAYLTSMRAALQPAFDMLFQSMAANMTPENAERVRTRFVTQSIQLIPAIFSVSATILLLFNLWAGGKVAALSGRLQRPWLPLGALDYPRYILALLAASLLLGRMEGFAGVAGMALSGGLLLSYFLLGAITLLVLTRGSSLRILAVLSIVLAAIIEPFALLISAFGVLETFLRFRAGRAAVSPRPNS